MRHLLPALLALPLAACVKFDLDEGPGDYALDFIGDPSCVTAEPPLSVPGRFTVEAWVQADKARDGGPYPLIMWPGAVELFVDEAGRTMLTDGTEARTGASFPDTWMDGGLHHVAGTWDGGTLRLFLDGALTGFAEAALFSNSAPDMYFGCHPFNQWHHQGLIDEVRLSREVRYPDDFTPLRGDFEPDDDTISLWHFSEGDGKKTADAMGKAQADLVAVDWVDFTLGDSEAADSGT